MASFSYDGLKNYTSNSGLGSIGVPNEGIAAYGTSVSSSFTGGFSSSPNIPDYAGSVLNTPASGANSKSFVFITPPQQVSYSQATELNQVTVFGSNSPPITVSGRGAKQLSLGDSLMEGFTLGKAVQLPIDQLFEMQKVILDSQKGFVDVPVYTVFAGQGPGSGKSYGDYVIEDISIDEEMRDLQGQATRARVNVSFKGVAKYQIGTGTDAASSTTGGQVISPERATGQAASQNASVAAANAGRNTPSSVRSQVAASAAARTGGSGSSQGPAIQGANFQRVRLGG